MSDYSNNTELKETRDGSHTLYSQKFDQHYHNPNGAIAESKHVFFEQSGLLDDLRHSRPVNILEIGFGTGLNLLLLIDYCHQYNSESAIHFYSIEGFPITPDTAKHLNYDEYLETPNLGNHLTTIFSNLSDGWNEFSISDQVTLHLFKGLFNDFKKDDLQADYLFHDAFSPDVNPELWTGRTFKKLLHHSHKKAVLSTYCAASKAQGALAWAGWKVAKTQGALGKREMIITSPSTNVLTDFKRINEEHYAQRYEENDFD